MANTLYPQLLSFSLYSSGASIGDTTLVLSTFTSIEGDLLTMANFGDKGFMTLEPGAGSNEEQISFTGVSQNANGTATLTGVSNVLMLSPYTETSGLTKPHSGGSTASVAITSGLLNQFANKGNAETITGTWSFPTYTSSDVNQVATIAYANALAIAGAPDASTTVKGNTQIATVAQQGTATATGSTGAVLVPANENLVKTSAGAGDENKIPILSAGGVIDQTFLDSVRTWGAVQSFTANNAQITTDPDSDNDAVRASRLNTLTATINNITTGEAIDGSTTPMAVAIKTSDGLLWKADANDTDLNKCIGFVISNALITTTPVIQTSGIVTFSGATLVKNSLYYLQDTVGTIGVTPSTTCSVPIGIATSTTTLLLTFGKKIARGTITHSAAGPGTQDVTTTVGFQPSVIIIGVTSLSENNGRTSTGVATYYGTTRIGACTSKSVGNDAVAVTSNNISTYTGDGDPTVQTSSSFGTRVNGVLTINSVSETGFVTRIVTTQTAGSGGTVAASLTYIAFE